MINIITAIGNEKINYLLKKNPNLYIKYDDIQYEEGLVEIIKKEEKIDYLILGEIILNNNIEVFLHTLLKLSKNTKIIFLIFNRETIQCIEENGLKEKIRILLTEKNRKEDYIVSKIENLIIENNKTENYKSDKYLKELREENIKIKKEMEELKNILIKKMTKNKIVLFLGEHGSGKSTLVSILGKQLCNFKNVLLIDMDFINNDIHTIFNVKKYNYIEDKTIIKSVNDKLKIISDMDIILEKWKNNRKNKLIYLFKKIKEKYEYILIDFNYDESDEEVINIFLEISDQIFFIINGDIVNIKRGKKLYKKIIEKINILNTKKEIFIIENKINKFSIDKKILENILNNKISAEVRYERNFIKEINNNLKYNKKNYLNNIIKIIRKEKTCGKFRIGE